MSIEIGQLLQEDIANASKIIFENGSGLTRRDDALSLANLSNGSATVLIASEADLPAVGADGFRTLEYDKNYIFTEPGIFTDNIAIPADWIGTIRKSFLTSESLTYTGGGFMFQTLLLGGAITAVADAGGGAITVTSATHGLIDGEFINITGTTNYNQTRLAVSNVTLNTFDVQIAFVADETGDFDTGYRSIQFIDFAVVNGATAFFMDLESSGDVTSSILFTRFAGAGFLGPGKLRNSQNLVTRDSVFAFLSEGLVLQDTVAAILETTNFASLSPAFPTAIALAIEGTATKRIGIINSTFNMTAVGQIPVRIEPTITTADEIKFDTSPDNSVATDYFDPTGLDETDPQVIAIDNGTRKNSQTISESSTVGILEVDGSGNIDVPIVDITPVSGDWSEDPATEGFSVDTTTGIVTCVGLKPISVMVKYSLSAAQSSGSAQTVEIDLHVNGIAQTKSQIIIVTSGVGNFIAGVYNGGNFTLNPGDTLQLFKNNTTNANNTDITNATLLVNLD